MFGTVGTAEYLPARLDAMTHNAATAMRTLRRECMDGAFKGVECMLLAFERYRKGLVIFVAADFAWSHNSFSISRRIE
jgi:hypothetical protein